MKISCRIFGCRSFADGTCHGCLRELDSQQRCQPFAPGAIEHAKAKASSATTHALRLLRVVRNMAISLFVLLAVYMAYWWPEIWHDAQIKHARNQATAVMSCSKDSLQ